MKIEKDGIVKDLSDEFLLKDYIAAGWKIYKEEKPSKKFKFDKD